ncbi:hypothetical protein QBC45DRAFT_198800 [Copromyces sp. CBS 386.78]|nr:hypothetical protein QBC45DRAFT_198800 [Copromyces sp. CBS 386.78]
MILWMMTKESATGRERKKDKILVWSGSESGPSASQPYQVAAAQQNNIQQAFRDMNTLASQEGVYRNIDWTAEAATDFWCPNIYTDPNFKIPDDTRSEIQRIFAAIEQVWSYPFPIFVGPGNYWRYLWIEVRCSDGELGKGSSDPENFCKDAAPNDGKCPNGQRPPANKTETLQAFSDPTGRYSRITFCNDFFKLHDLSVTVENGARSAKKTDLSEYDNTARVFLHELTHLDYFVGTDPTGKNDPKSNIPYIWDLQITINENGARVDRPCYGPEYCRILRNWVDPDPQDLGYYTQRNADSYAWFAMAKYVQSKIGQYPAQPRVGRKKPRYAPVNSKNGLEPQDAPANLSTTSLDNYQIGGDEDAAPLNFNFPGCGDRIY